MKNTRETCFLIYISTIAVIAFGICGIINIFKMYTQSNAIVFSVLLLLPTIISIVYVIVDTKLLGKIVDFNIIEKKGLCKLRRKKIAIKNCVEDINMYTYVVILVSIIIGSAMFQTKFIEVSYIFIAIIMIAISHIVLLTKLKKM